MADSAFLKLVAVVGAIVVLVSGFALVANSRLQIGSIGDLDSYGLDLCTVEDGAQKDVRGYGRFSDLPGDARQRGEFFSTSRIWYSWFRVVMASGMPRPSTVTTSKSTSGT